MDVIRAVRGRRAEMNVPPSKKAHLTIVSQYGDVFRRGVPFLQRLAAGESVTITAETPASLEGMVSVATPAAQVYIPLAELVDLEKEKARVAKELQKARENLDRIQKRLANESFVSKAPEAVIAGVRDSEAKAKSLIAKLEESAAALGL